MLRINEPSGNVCEQISLVNSGRNPPYQPSRRPAIRPVISGDPEIGPLARRVTGCGASAPAPVGALLPHFLGSRNGQGAPGARRPLQPGGGALAALCCQ